MLADEASAPRVQQYAVKRGAPEPTISVKRVAWGDTASASGPAHGADVTASGSGPAHGADVTVSASGQATSRRLARTCRWPKQWVQSYVH